MGATTQRESSTEADASVLPYLNVVILYEDFGTGLRAKHSLDLLPKRLPPNAPLNTKLWRIELLADPLLGEQAALEAAVADVIIISLHGRRGLPDQVQQWLTRWLAHKEPRRYALGVLLDSGEASRGSENLVVASMKQVAARAGADLFYGFAEAGGGRLDAALDEIKERAHSSSTVLENMLKRTAPPTRRNTSD